MLSIVFAKQFWHSWRVTVVDDHYNFQIHANYLTECLARKNSVLVNRSVNACLRVTLTPSPLPLTPPSSDLPSPLLLHLLSTASHHVDVSGGGVFEQKRHAGVATPHGERRSTGARVQSRDGQRRCFGYQRYRRQKLLLARVQRGHVSVS